MLPNGLAHALQVWSFLGSRFSLSGVPCISLRVPSRLPLRCKRTVTEHLRGLAYVASRQMRTADEHKEARLERIRRCATLQGHISAYSPCRATAHAS